MSIPTWLRMASSGDRQHTHPTTWQAILQAPPFLLVAKGLKPMGLNPGGLLGGSRLCRSSSPLSSAARHDVTSPPSPRTH